MELGLTDRVCLVTGASAGIGRGIALNLAAEGAKLAVLARRRQLLDELADEIAATGRERPLVIVQDLMSDDAPGRVRDAVLQAYDTVHVLVNNAGGSRKLPVEASDDEWDEGMTLNFTALRRLTHALLPSMRAQKWGRIVNITGSSEPRSLNAANSASAAVHAWAKGLSRDVGREGITVNSVPPGRIMSEQIVLRVHPDEAERQRFADQEIPVGYFGEPDDIANLVAFLASPKARYITGEIIHVDGGLRRFAQ